MHYHLESCSHGSVLDVEGSGKVGAGLSWREPSSTHLTLVGSPEAEAGHVHGEVAPPMFSEIEA